MEVWICSIATGLSGISSPDMFNQLVKTVAWQHCYLWYLITWAPACTFPAYLFPFLFYFISNLKYRDTVTYKLNNALFEIIVHYLTCTSLYLCMVNACLCLKLLVTTLLKFNNKKVFTDLWLSNTNDNCELKNKYFKKGAHTVQHHSLHTWNCPFCSASMIA